MWIHGESQSQEPHLPAGNLDLGKEHKSYLPPTSPCLVSLGEGLQGQIVQSLAPAGVHLEQGLHSQMPTSKVGNKNE